MCPLPDSPLPFCHQSLLRQRCCLHFLPSINRGLAPSSLSIGRLTEASLVGPLPNCPDNEAMMIVDSSRECLRSASPLRRAEAQQLRCGFLSLSDTATKCQWLSSNAFVWKRQYFCLSSELSCDLCMHIMISTTNLRHKAHSLLVVNVYLSAVKTTC